MRTATLPAACTKVALGKSITTGKVTPSIVPVRPVEVTTLPRFLSSSRGFLQGEVITVPVPVNTATPTTPAPPVECKDMSAYIYTGMWTALLVKPPVSAPAVTPDGVPDNTLTTPSVPFGPFIVGFVGATVNSPEEGAVTPPTVVIPPGKWEGVIPDIQCSTKVLVFFGVFATCPTVGPTGVPPVGPTPASLTECTTVGPNTDPNLSTVLGTVWPPDAKVGGTDPTTPV